jgi:hypothetical protein
MKGYGCSNEVDVIGRVGINRRGGYVSIPETRRGERDKTIKAGELAYSHTGAGSGLSKRHRGQNKQNNNCKNKRAI